MTAYEIPIEKVRRRADFFHVVARLICETEPLTTYEFQLSSAHAEQLAEAYFLLSEAYKHQRMTGPRTRTQETKIAALTCLTIGALNPLRPNPERVPESHPAIFAYANPMFAMRCACSIVDHPFETRAFDDRARFYDSLRRLSLPALNAYMAAARSGRKVGTAFDIELSFEEIRAIEDKISLFVVLKELQIFKKD